MDRKETNKLMRQFFDERAENWDYRAMTRASRIKELLTGIVNKGDKVFDLACGTGTIDDTLIELGASEVFAIDLSEKMIEKAIQKNTNPNITYKVMDFCDYEGSGYDLVVIYNSYVHIVERDVLLEKIVSILKPNGRFAIINTSNYEKINAQHSQGIEVPISHTMKKPEEEQLFFADYFNIDMLQDDENTYIISGTKK